MLFKNVFNYSEDGKNICKSKNKVLSLKADQSQNILHWFLNISFILKIDNMSLLISKFILVYLSCSKSINLSLSLYIYIYIYIYNLLIYISVPYINILTHIYVYIYIYQGRKR